MANAAANGVNSLWNISPIVTILVLLNMFLFYFVRALLLDAKEERSLYRKSLIDNTEAFNGLKEIIRAAISK